MIAVIQCAGTKNPRAGTLQQGDGKRVEFVANPDAMPDDAKAASCTYARPDDASDSGDSWRVRLLEYNNHFRQTGQNSLSLLPAWKLYKNSIYSRLAKAYGTNRLYILSAGWGLISADFLTPAYDITFSRGKRIPKYKRRGKYGCYCKGRERRNSEDFDDLCQLFPESRVPLLFIGGKDYLPLFCQLTRPLDCQKIAFYNSTEPPCTSNCDCDLKSFDAKRNQNWHYDLACQLIDGTIEV